MLLSFRKSATLSPFDSVTSNSAKQKGVDQCTHSRGKDPAEDLRLQLRVCFRAEHTIHKPASVRRYSRSSDIEPKFCKVLYNLQVELRT